MAHHGSNPEMERALRAQMKDLLGEFPEGKLNDADEGAIAVGIGHQDGKVVIQFPKPVNWIGFTPEQAMGIAEGLIHHARACGYIAPLVLRVK